MVSKTSGCPILTERSVDPLFSAGHLRDQHLGKSERNGAAPIRKKRESRWGSLIQMVKSLQVVVCIKQLVNISILHEWVWWLPMENQQEVQKCALFVNDTSSPFENGMRNTPWLWVMSLWVQLSFQYGSVFCSGAFNWSKVRTCTCTYTKWCCLLKVCIAMGVICSELFDGMGPGG